MMNESKSELWRHLLLLALVLGSFCILMLQAPIRQDPAYHKFIDTRSLFGLPNFYNVVSNLPFLLVGFAGVVFCSMRVGGFPKAAWTFFFAGIALVGMGSAYYHLSPDNERLLWDRLPMTVGFMAMFVALLGEFIDPRLTRYLLLPGIFVGLASVLVWHWCDDLRLYAWVQFMPMLVIPALLFLYRKKYSHSWLIMWALACYVIAKALEAFDAGVFRVLQNEMAGHAIKHVFAALGAAVILWMLRVRKPLG